MNLTKLTLTPELAAHPAAGDKPLVFTPPPPEPEPEPERLVVEYHHEPGHDTRDVLATTFLTPVLARE